MPEPRIAKSLDTLRSQVQEEFPSVPRSPVYFGWLGDAAHRKRKSDHNPDRPSGVVRALDIPHFPGKGLNTYVLADYMIAHPDKRLRYIISNGRITGNAAFVAQNPQYGCRRAWRWGRYRGKNKHDRHMHISVVRVPVLYDDPEPWDLGFKPPAPAEEMVA